MKEYHFSGKFYGGIILIAVSLIIGKITQVLFLFHYNNPSIRWTALIIYILSWIPFFIGAWWVGKEYTNAIRKYFSYKYYHQTIKSGTQKAIAKTKERTKNLQNKVKKTFDLQKEKHKSSAKKERLFL